MQVRLFSNLHAKISMAYNKSIYFLVKKQKMAFVLAIFPKREIFYRMLIR